MTSALLLVALPENYLDDIPEDTTILLDEWTLSLRPLDSVRSLSEEMLSDDDNWTVRDHFADPTIEAIELVRQAAFDAEIVGAFQTARAMLVRPGFGLAESERYVQTLIRQDSAGDVGVTDAGVSILLGLAVLCAYIDPIGVHGREAWRAGQPKLDPDSAPMD